MAKKTKDTSVSPVYITLPWSAFFDQELGEVVFNKLMKAPVKDYQILLRLSKLWKTINDIAKDLSVKRDEIAKEAGVDMYLKPDTALTPETMSSEEYQTKAKKFGELLQEKIFDKEFSLEPLWSLTLDLTNPDGHARSFLEWSNLSADDIMKLEESWIVKVIYPADDSKADDNKDVLVPNETKENDN